MMEYRRGHDCFYQTAYDGEHPGQNDKKLNLKTVDDE